jgi:ribosomal protein S18 acetylase RimI-like enzyme
MTRVVAISDAPPRDRASLIEQATAIFWATAGSPSFESPDAQRAFHRRWFGLYLESEPERFFLALDGSGAVTGYLAACLDSFAPAAQPIVDGIAYSTPDIRAALAACPSHFHINVKPGCQGRGIGHRLVARLMETCASEGSRGVHVVTGASSRAVRFYEACGFRRIAAAGDSPSLAVLVAPLSRPELGET